MDDAITGGGNVRIMCDDDEGLPLIFVQRTHQRQHIVGGLAVERAGRLVRPDDRRIVDERARNCHALTLSARKLRRTMVAAVDQPDLLQHFQSAFACSVWAHPRHQQGQLDIFHSSDHRQQVVGLKDKTHALRTIEGAFLVAHRAQPHALDVDLALVKIVETGEAVEQCGLATARWPHNGDHFTRLHGNVDAAQRVHFNLAGAKPFLHCIGGNNWLFHC